MNFIFDFDGTIVDSQAAFISVFNKNLRHSDNPLSVIEIEELRGMSSRRALRHIGIKWWQLSKLFISGSHDFYQLLPTLKPFNDVTAVLQQLHDRGDKLYIVTSNGKHSVNAFLSQHNLAHLFTEIVTDASVFNKSRYICRLIIRQQLHRRETVYVGDETRDISAARLARLRIVSVSWGFNTKKILKKRRPNYLIDTPKELLSLGIRA